MVDRAAPPRPTPSGFRPRSAAMQFRRAVTLLVLTLVVPGSSQYIVGNRRVGRVALRCWLGLLGLLALAAVIALLDPMLVVAVVSNTAVLAVLQAVLILLALGWLGLFFDSWRLGRPRRLVPRQRATAAGLTGLFSVVTTGAMLLSSHYVAVASTSLDSIFTHTTVSNSRDGRYNVMLLGGDAGSDRVGLRPDSITLASIDADTGRTVLFSLPRNLYNVPFAAGSVMHKRFPHGFGCGDACLLNAVYTWGQQHAELWPAGAEPGLDATRSAVEGVTGLKVNYYALVDMEGFKDLVDAVGGIDIDVKHALPLGSTHTVPAGWITTGEHHMNGNQALWFARSRANSSDYNRMARQKCVMAAMLDQLDPSTVVAKFTAIADAGRQIVSTDLPAREIGRFLTLARKARTQPITSVSFVPPLVDVVHPDFAAIHRKVAKTIERSQKADEAAAARAATPTASPTPTKPATPGATGTSGNSGTTPTTAGQRASDEPVITKKRPPDSGITGDPAPVARNLDAVCAAG